MQMSRFLFFPHDALRTVSNTAWLDTKNASLQLENLVLGKKSNHQTKTMTTKTNYKPKANDKGKENNAIFFETWPSSV